MGDRGRALASSLVLGVAALSGVSLYLIKDVAPRLDGWSASGWRLCIAAAVVVVLFGRRLGELDRSEWRVVVSLGQLYGVAIILQTLSLQHTSVSHAAVFLGTYIVFTPLISVVLGALNASRQLWWSVGITFAGLALLSGWSNSYGLFGDFLALLAAVCWAVVFAVTERVVRNRDSTRIAFGQLVCTAPLGLLALALSSSPFVPTGFDVWTAILVSALVPTVLGVIVQLYAQQRISATAVALLFAVQTPVALLCGVLIAGDELSWLAILGLVFAFTGIALGVRLKSPTPTDAPTPTGAPTPTDAPFSSQPPRQKGSVAEANPVIPSGNECNP